MRYPIYIPSRGRWQDNRALTAKTLAADGTPFRLVVEADEVEQYRELVHALTQSAAERGKALDAQVLVLADADGNPLSGEGSSVTARNWIKDHSIAAGHARHWQLDDNLIEFRRLVKSRRIPCDSDVALGVVEDFADRYTNVAVAGLAYQMFISSTNYGLGPFTLNCHVYSCTLVDNALPFRWRGRRNEDTDLCLQVLAAGYCTVQVNAFMCNKLRTMASKGGNTDVLYQGDGRLEMAQELERRWPGVVRVTRKFGRPQHHVDWTKFTTPLERRPDVDFDALAQQGADERGLKLKAKGEVKSPALRALVEEHPS